MWSHFTDVSTLIYDAGVKIAFDVSVPGLWKPELTGYGFACSAIVPQDRYDQAVPIGLGVTLPDDKTQIVDLPADNDYVIVASRQKGSGGSLDFWRVTAGRGRAVVLPTPGIGRTMGIDDDFDALVAPNGWLVVVFKTGYPSGQGHPGLRLYAVDLSGGELDSGSFWDISDDGSNPIVVSDESSRLLVLYGKNATVHASVLEWKNGAPSVVREDDLGLIYDYISGPKEIVRGGSAWFLLSGLANGDRRVQAVEISW